jgi:hypothetical protein
MIRPRAVFFIIFALGVASTAAFHSSGALDVRDAITAAALETGTAGSPPLPLTSRGLGLGVDLVRLVWSKTGLFRAMHLTGGLLLSVAAGLSALVAFRVAGRSVAGLAAALFVGLATLFGGDSGRLGLSGSPVSVLFVLLAGAAAAWTAKAPRAFTGGLLLGAAAAEHPFVLFLLPGFVALGRSQAPAAGFVPRASTGFGLGLLALFLPVWDSAAKLGPMESLFAWAASDDGSFWRFGGPRRWTGGALELGLAIGKGAGVVGALLCLGGAVRTGFRRMAPWLVPAGALVLGQPADTGTASALIGWSFLFLAIPAVAEVYRRLGGFAADDTKRRAATRTVIVGFVGGFLVLATSLRTIDRSAEKEILWSRKSFDIVPQESLLLTRDPVHMALSADGERPDVDVVWVEDPATLVSRHPNRVVHAPPVRPGERMSGEFLSEVVGLNHGQRPVLVDPGFFFDVEQRLALLGDRWRAVPHGLAYRLVGKEDLILEQDAIAMKSLWDDIDLNQSSPPSSLRDGKTVAGYYSRSLLQAASLYVDLALEHSAERDFLMLLTLDEANHSLAALGLAQLLHRQHAFGQAIATLEQYARESDDGAWLAYRFLGHTYLAVDQLDQAIPALETALRLLPPEAAPERDTIQGRLDRTRKRLARQAESS